MKQKIIYKYIRTLVVALFLLNGAQHAEAQQIDGHVFEWSDGKKYPWWVPPNLFTKGIHILA